MCHRRNVEVKRLNDSLSVDVLPGTERKNSRTILQGGTVVTVGGKKKVKSAIEIFMK